MLPVNDTAQQSVGPEPRRSTEGRESTLAHRTTVQLVDDLDGTASEDITTVTFGLDGVDYEIDLTDENAARLRDGLAAFVASARRTGGRIKRGLGGSTPVLTTEERARNQAIREWARSKGWSISDRGRVPANVIEAYDEAQAAPKKPAGRRRKTK